MNERQKKFVAAYARLGNAAQAAIEAGYSKKTARQMGQELLTKPDIKNAIASLVAEHQSKLIASAVERQRFWTSIMRGEGDHATSELKDRIKASELLGKVQGDFIERVEQVNYNVDDLQAMTDEELETVATKLGLIRSASHSD